MALFPLHEAHLVHLFTPGTLQPMLSVRGIKVAVSYLPVTIPFVLLNPWSPHPFFNGGFFSWTTCPRVINGNFLLLPLNLLTFAILTQSPALQVLQTQIPTLDN